MVSPACPLLRSLKKSLYHNWTDIELIEKTKYLLYKPESSLEKEQLTLLDALLTKCPTIQIAYQLVQQFASWYHKRDIGKPLYIIKSELEKWKENVRRVKLKAITHVMNMVERHQEDILRYFEKGLTNAKAENLNASIQRFIINNYGMRNRDFFFYRLQIYFSTPVSQKKI